MLGRVGQGTKGCSRISGRLKYYPGSPVLHFVPLIANDSSSVGCPIFEKQRLLSIKPS